MENRDHKGRFQKGNKLSVGRPHNDKYLETRAAVMGILQDEISLDDWKDIVKKQVQQAKNGNWRSVRFLADYVLGAPPESAPRDTEKQIIILGWRNQPAEQSETIIQLGEIASGE